MKTLQETLSNPSGWDSMQNYMGEIPEPSWLVLLTRNRDSDLLTESNWEGALKTLGGEGENVEIFRFGHWACGWWEALCVKEGTEKEIIANTLEKRLENYPILNEDEFSQREYEEANRVWKECYNARERAEYIRKHQNQFEFHSFSDIRATVRGDYFSGYASELIY
jgi:hypothetical protein